MKNSNYRAICIGITEYAHQKICSLRYDEKDCIDLAAKLMDDDIGLFEKEKVETILGHRAKQGAINRILHDEVLNCQKADTILLYFSGHTYQYENEYYFLPYNADLEKLKDDPDSYMSLRSMRKEIFQKSPAQHLVVILDTCFSGSMLLKEAHVPSPNEILLQRDREQPAQPRRR